MSCNGWSVSAGRRATGAASGCASRSSRLLVRVPDEASAAIVARHEGQILDELNVKAVERLAPDAKLVSYRIKPNLPRIGKRYGRRVPAIRDALANADASAIAAAVATGRAVHARCRAVRRRVVRRSAVRQRAARRSRGRRDPHLRDRGCARGNHLGRGLCVRGGGRLPRRPGHCADRGPSNARAWPGSWSAPCRRRASRRGLDVSDRIRLRIEGSPDVAAALDAHRAYVMEETLATGWGEADWSPAYSVEHTLGTERWTIGLARVDGGEPPERRQSTGQGRRGGSSHAASNAAQAAANGSIGGR